MRLREDVDLGQQRAVLALVLVEMEVAVGDLDALPRARSGIRRVAPQLGQRQVDVARSSGKRSTSSTVLMSRIR